jgi:hypothetical protein
MNEYAALHKKLMFDKFPEKLVRNKPAGLPELDGVKFDAKAKGIYDLVFAFVFSLDEMEKTIQDIAAKEMLQDGGRLYLAYPKKGNKEYAEYINRDDIFPRLGVDEDDGFVDGAPLKFCKMAAFNETFTVVGLCYFPGKSKAKKSAGTRVDDYVEKMPALRVALKKRPEILALYNALSPGYQKDWARYVYSAKTEATREKRLEEMADILRAGYKSKDLYRLKKK